MKSTSLFGVWILCAGVAAGCGGGEDASEQAEVTGQENARPRLVSATGCLTSEGDRYVLTSLESGAAGERVAGRNENLPSPTAENQPTTETYQLVGSDEELRGLVGQQVRVSGEAPPPQVAEVRESTPQVPPANAGGAGTTGGARGTTGQSSDRPSPQVATATETRLEVTRLTVRSITGTGETCPGAAPAENQPRR